MLLSVLALVAVLAVVAWGISDALAARHDLIAARDAVQQLETVSGVSRATTDSDLATALREASAAQRSMSQPGAALLAHVPLIGRTWVAERTIADASAAVLRASRVLLDDAYQVGTDGGVNLARLTAARRQLLSAQQSVAGPLGQLAALNTALTPPGVASGVAQAREKLLPVRTLVQQAAAGSAAIQQIFGGQGPRTLLLVLQNNAELRATGGVIGSLAVAHSRAGRLHVGTFRDIDRVNQPPAAARPVPAPADYTATYGPYRANTTLWKNVNFSPSVPDSARVLAELAARTYGVHPDCVVMLDVPALAALVDASGISVRLPDGTAVGGSALLSGLLVRQYAVTGNQPGAQARRHTALERSADRALQQALSSPPSIAVLRALGQQVAGRHVTLWSSDGNTERDLVAAGAAGDLIGPPTLSGPPTDVSMISADNLGDSRGQGNKLDYYARRSISITAAVGHGAATVQEKVVFHNTAPAGLPQYVAGPKHPGRLSELWSFTMPARANVEGLSVNGRPGHGAVAPIDGQRQLLTPVITARGATSTLVLTYRLPFSGDQFSLRVLPQPLALPAQLTVRTYGADGATLSDPVNETTSFDAPVTVSSAVH